MAEDLQLLATQNLSFEEALVLTQTLLDQAVEDALSPAELQQAVTNLVGTENGARGFFVVYLSDSRSQMEDYAGLVIAALQASPEVVSPLLVKNLAMSTAMILTHQRNQKPELVAGSEQVQRRSQVFIQQLQTPELQEHIRALWHSVATATGAYQAFLERWQYDAEQRQAIAQALTQTGLVSLDESERLKP